MCGLTKTKIYRRLFTLVAVAVYLVINPVVDLALAGAIIHSAAERAALCQVALHLSIRMRAVNVVAYAKLPHGSDLFVLASKHEQVMRFLKKLTSVCSSGS